MRYHLTTAVLVGLLFTATIAFATGPAEGEPAPPPAEIAAPIGVRSDAIHHATGFTIDTYDDFSVVTVTRPWQASTPDDEFTYVLYPRGTEKPSGFEGASFVETPVESVVTMSTTFLPHLERLDEVDALSGHDALAFVYSPAVLARAETGSIAEVGMGVMVDLEMLVAMDPDVIFVNSYGGEWDAQPLLDEAGLPTVVSGDWVETSPLGRAEWLLFTSMFFDKFDEATSQIAGIEAEYARLQGLAAQAETRPSVLINAPYGGTWSAAGGASYAAQFISDAGGRYVWEDDETTGGLFLDLETVFDEAGEADYWINPGTWTSLADGTAEDERFAEFFAFRSGNVFNNNARVSEGGGIDYFESGATNPHMVLADLLSIFHPELLGDHEFYYYQKLE